MMLDRKKTTTLNSRSCWSPAATGTGVYNSSVVDPGLAVCSSEVGLVPGMYNYVAEVPRPTMAAAKAQSHFFVAAVEGQPSRSSRGSEGAVILHGAGLPTAAMQAYRVVEERCLRAVDWASRLVGRELAIQSVVH